MANETILNSHFKPACGKNSPFPNGSGLFVIFLRFRITPLSCMGGFSLDRCLCRATLSGSSSQSVCGMPALNAPPPETLSLLSITAMHGHLHSNEPPSPSPTQCHRANGTPPDKLCSSLNSLSAIAGQIWILSRGKRTAKAD